MGTEVVPRSEMRGIKCGIASENQEGGKSSKQEIGDGEIGQETVVNEQGNAEEKRRKLQREEHEAQHGGEGKAYLRLPMICQQ